MVREARSGVLGQCALGSRSGTRAVCPLDLHRRRPRAHARRGLTMAEVAVVVVIALILMGVFIFAYPHMGRQRYTSKRTVCSLNLKVMGTAFYTYANENNDMWPIVPHAVAQEEGVGRVTYAPKMIGVRRAGVASRPFAPVSESRPADGGSTVSDTALSTTRNLWLLVRAGMSNRLGPSRCTFSRASFLVRRQLELIANHQGGAA